ncbi:MULTISPECIES: dTDP-4-dehydrorhamnose 3,5-epimerase family protein [unclassified Streptomyces]|uniref:dTDP-4-dehydrorhamnose 3,5-epimerase family protein n=1 Tax=unclassified Streptomyces TaxID=2593676 RepID=UPI002DD85030|nr:MULTISPECIES: dTDP-4-dehydrorhamnose 3,5-epimerase family protein [unclassified Streptomyces]WSA95907.1 dTDP-4-dehydrorhamnose 3,5-epimerase family protein [Streptomyces sp. NBC_01795]WSB80322.1 dTDP-4-dehydrorhamnose 3,5-epimerase family protein [Streptomyces sp. NBC_01775]WSS11467.1 dTDP-4-dehydrorhamnose 3,5-epimerase family protein [Streptomyces sp. NBC_01186]WSS40181.1 dTDP-4-dehydrorhamnose 3,5-epimerase family protein [Streptomyces sp. NBC_01187]
MDYRKLKVEGAVEFSPRKFADSRGHFAAQLQRPVFQEAVGRPPFDVAQVNLSRSHRGALRGIHFTSVPPGAAKYVYCAHGAALDIVLDTRVGSPTFGEWDLVRIDAENARAVHVPVGVGHGFLALEDETVVTYLVSADYAPEHEHTLSPLDPGLGLPLPPEVEPLVSDRDREAPTLQEALAGGLLPDYESARRD